MDDTTDAILAYVKKNIYILYYDYRGENILANDNSLGMFITDVDLFIGCKY